MQQLYLGLGVAALLGAAVAWSQTRGPRSDFEFDPAKRNPVTHLRLNNNPDGFQFAIVSDRTGGHRPKVFSRAVDQLNLMQPEFVLSVGDLIEGYSTNKDVVDKQWREFQTYTSRLKMPFFYVPGNHDITNKMMDGLWKDRFGRSYYEFVYRNVLMVVLNSEDPPATGSARISAEQLAWLDKVLKANSGVRWTLVFLHKPMWVMPDVDKNGWLEVEKQLAGRNYTVFAGHVHRYQKFVRQGQNYYMLGTTGGDSRLRGPEYGEVDHITWVTLGPKGPVLANVLLDGIVREDLATIPSEEEGVSEYYHRPTHPVTVQVVLKGQPVAGAYVVFSGAGKEPRQPRADGYTSSDGTTKLSTYKAFDGAPVGEYIVTVEQRKPLFLPDGKRGPNQLPAAYAEGKTSPLKAEIKSGSNKLVLELTTTPNAEKK
ncbi:MAG: metallophosphoesterase [Gemmataceae bacterium]